MKMGKTSTAHASASHGYGRRLLRIGAVLAMLVGLPIPILQASSVYAASTTSATFTAGGFLKGGIYYAKTGATLTLTVATSSDTKCVEVTGAPVTGSSSGK